MDNTFFSGINSGVSGIIGMAMLSVGVILTLVWGALVGYSAYRSFVEGPKQWKGSGGSTHYRAGGRKH